jgi:hypothetical protein
VGPFEQLSGAGYALTIAIRFGVGRQYRRLGYHDRVRRPLIPRLVAYLNTDEPDEIVADWRASFYFNAAKQRIVWADERLLRAAATASCPRCDWPSPYRGSDIAKIVEATTRHIEHSETHQKPLTTTSEIVRLHQPGEALRQLRASVNLRKHSIYPEELHVREGATAESEQLRLACNVFVRLVAAYCELEGWAPRLKRGP